MNYALYAFIAMGGALGAIARHVISTWIYNTGDFVFAWGTFAVNVLGCFFLGLVYVLGTEKLVISPNVRAFLAVGFMGAFTTFSTFSLETLNIIKAGNIKIALLNTVGSIVLGLFAVWIGTVCAEILINIRRKQKNGENFRL
ncbi:MAG: chromosome condensation protein CrcB [Desulfitibacter sp. BRH_c19]|nr:MAG: chromosome condensation protein CrcB [Desulfitibacter sp. BRH_c19]